MRGTHGWSSATLGIECEAAARTILSVTDAGKSDRIDAEAAARSVLAGQATATPKTADGAVEMIRPLKVARDTAVKARTAAMNTLKQISVNAPSVVGCRRQFSASGARAYPVEASAEHRPRLLGVAAPRKSEAPERK